MSVQDPVVSSISLKKRVLFGGIVAILTYAIAEVVASSAAWWGWWGVSFYVTEDAGRAIEFDPIRGYRLLKTQSRYMRISDGLVEFVGVPRGNNRGFPDRDDFGQARSSPVKRRFAVFGDSYTAAQHLGQNWPDLVEDLLRSRGETLELLNFSIEGGGLANWWSVLRRIVDVESYELDGVIFAVCTDDLLRRFHFRAYRGASHREFYHGVWPDWDPATYRKDFAEAEPHAKPTRSVYNLSPEEFERMLQGRWSELTSRRFRPFLLFKAGGVIRRILPRSPQPPGPAPDPHREAIISDISRFLASRNLPAMVIHLPTREELEASGKARADAQREKVAAFAQSLGATFLDGLQPFRGLSSAESRAQFLPFDPHWNQTGSNRFARFMAEQLAEWSRRNPGATSGSAREASPSRLIRPVRGEPGEERREFGPTAPEKLGA